MDGSIQARIFIYMEILHTRLRYIAAARLDEIEMAINKLKFKIELKQLVKDKNGWIQTFVLPEVEGLDWQSVDLRKI